MKLLLFISFLFIATLADNCNDAAPKPANYIYIDTPYQTGEILPPDYACTDSVIVTDGQGLTAAMENLYQSGGGSDADIDSVIHLYSITLNK